MSKDTMSDIDISKLKSLEINTMYSQLTLRKMQLNERHCTIMEAWDDKSMNKTNKILRRMYNPAATQWDKLSLTTGLFLCPHCTT
jgi:hypothetical protein